MYLHKQISALHTLCGPSQIEKRRKSAKNNTEKGVYQHLGATFICWLKPKPWLTPVENVIFHQQIDVNITVTQLKILKL